MDLRTSPFEEGETNVDIERDSPEQGKNKEKQRGGRDPLCDMGGPMTRLKVNRMQQSLYQLIMEVCEQERLKSEVLAPVNVLSLKMNELLDSCRSPEALPDTRRSPEDTGVPPDHFDIALGFLGC